MSCAEYQLLALDLDGTLLNSHHQITPDPLHQLNRLPHHTADHDHDGIAAVLARF